MRRPLLKLTSASATSTARKIVLPATIACCAILIWRRWDLFYALTTISTNGFLLTTAIGFLLNIIGALKFRSVTDFFSISLSCKEWFGLTAVTNLYSKILPSRLGCVPRAWYLKKHYKLNYTSYISIFGGSTVVDLLLNSLLGVVILSASLTTHSSNLNFIENGFILSLVVGLLGALAIIACRFFKIKTGFQKIDRLANSAFSALEIFQKKPRSLFNLTVISAVLVGAQTLSLWSCYYVVGEMPSILLLIVAISAMNLSSVISLTPGNIGISEGMIVAVMSLADVPLGLSVSASVLYRVTALFPQIVMGIIFTYTLFGKIFDSTSVESLQHEIA